MNLELNGKTALVTGASTGIGNAIARGLAQEGVRLCVAARRGNLLEAFAKEIVAFGAQAPEIAVIDIVAEGAPEKLAAHATRALGRVDILINCAGTGRPTINFDAPEEEWESMMTLNFNRVRQLTHAVLPGMVRQRWGRVINITGKSEMTGLFTTLSAKAAVHAWSKGLSRQVGKHGITVNSIAPGKILSEQIQAKYSPEFREEESQRDIPAGRYGEPEELAAAAIFLASQAASYITGVVLPVDGGLRHYAF